MVIIFYNANEEKIYICTEFEKTKIISIHDPNLLNYVPNDDILYVQNAHYITKYQLSQWLNGQESTTQQDELPEPDSNRFAGFLNENKITSVSDDGRKHYFHPCTNGTISMVDIKTEKFPDGIILHGKYEFFDIDSIGQDVFDESPVFKILLGTGKIELVDLKYIKDNIHKKKKPVSATEAELNKILVPAHIRATDAVSSAYKTSSDPIEIIVEGD